MGILVITQATSAQTTAEVLTHLRARQREATDAVNAAEAILRSAAAGGTRTGDLEVLSADARDKALRLLDESTAKLKEIDEEIQAKRTQVQQQEAIAGSFAASVVASLLQENARGVREAHDNIQYLAQADAVDGFTAAQMTALHLNASNPLVVAQILLAQRDLADSPNYTEFGRGETEAFLINLVAKGAEVVAYEGAPVRGLNVAIVNTFGGSAQVDPRLTSAINGYNTALVQATAPAVATEEFGGVALA